MEFYLDTLPEELIFELFYILKSDSKNLCINDTLTRLYKKFIDNIKLGLIEPELIFCTRAVGNLCISEIEEIQFGLNKKKLQSNTQNDMLVKSYYKLDVTYVRVRLTDIPITIFVLGKNKLGYISIIDKTFAIDPSADILCYGTWKELVRHIDGSVFNFILEREGYK